MNSTELKWTQNIKLYYFVRTILSIPFCPIPFCPYTILSIPFCPYHFVRYHFVRSPINAVVPVANDEPKIRTHIVVNKNCDSRSVVVYRSFPRNHMPRSILWKKWKIRTLFLKTITLNHQCMKIGGGGV